MKVLFVLWPQKDFSPQQRKDILLTQCAQEILVAGADRLSMNIDDEFSQVKSPAPKFYKGPAIVATVSVYFDSDGQHSSTIEKMEKSLVDQGFEVGTYFVSESIYKDYGDNEHFRRRDWLDGERSPTVMAITLLTKPGKFSHDEWIKRWHGKMSPVSEELQPRARYVRNVVTGVGDASPAYDGIVEEAWPSAEHITNPYLFYKADNVWRLIINMLKMLQVVTQFHQLHKIRTVTMSEYFIKS